MISDDFKHDLIWFNSFLPVFNCVSFFNYTPRKLVHLDACPSDLGAIFDNQVYDLSMIEYWKDENIAYTELFSVLVAFKIWHTQWAGLRVLIKCEGARWSSG